MSLFEVFRVSLISVSQLQERLKAIKKNHGEKELGKVTVNMLIGGMRGIPVRLSWRIPD